MTDWRVSFFRGEASLQARHLEVGAARVEQAVLRLIDVTGPVELEGGIEPFANHRTALERLELVIDPSAHLLERESARWRDGTLHITTDAVCGELVVDRLGDRGLRLVPLRAWTATRGEGGAFSLLLRWVQERLGGVMVDDPVELFAKRGLVQAGRRRTRLEGGRVGWTHEGEQPVYIFDRSETPGEPLPMQSLAADFEALLERMVAGDLHGAAQMARERLMEGGLSAEAVPLAVDLLAERDDALDLLADLLPRVDRLTRALALARRRPSVAAWMDAAEACRAHQFDALEHAALLEMLDAGVQPAKVGSVIERLLELGRCDDDVLARLADAAERNEHPRLAISILRRLVGRKAVDESVREVVRLGELHLGEGNRPRARHYFALALTVSENAAALEGAAWIALEDDDIDYAITCLERAARHERVESQRRATHWRTVARLRYERGASDLAAAVSCLQEASLLDPDGRAEDLRQAALWWREVGQLERALSCVEARLELPGEAARWEFEAAQLLLALGRPGEASGAAARALADDELAPQVFPVAVRALQQAARDDALPALVAQWFAREPESVSDDLVEIAALALGDRGAMAERVLAHRPGDHAQLFRLVVEDRFAQGDFEEGAELLSRALDHHPNELSLWRLRQRQAEHDEQALLRVEALEQLHRLDPTEERSLTLAEAHVGVQNFSAAVALFEEAPSGRLRAAAIYLDHFGAPARCLELLGAPDRGDVEQLLLGERASLLDAQALTDPWSLALVDLGLDRVHDPDRVARLILSSEVSDDDAERLALSLVERGELEADQLRSLLAGVEGRALPVSTGRILDALREVAPEPGLDRARLDLALEAHDRQRADDLMAALYPEDAVDFVGGDRDRLDAYLALVERTGAGSPLERCLRQFAELTQDAGLWKKLAALLSDLGRYQDACAAFAHGYSLEKSLSALDAATWIESARNLSETEPLRQAVDAAGAALDADAEERAVVELAERLEGAAALPYWRRARHLAPEDHTIVRRYAIRAVDVLPPLESLELVEDWLKQAGQLPPEGLTAVVRSLATRMSAEGLADRARSLLGAASRRFPQEFELASTWISTVDEVGDHELSASVRVEAAEHLEDRRADTWLREAVDLFRSKASQHDQAMDLLDLLMERRPDDPEPALQLEQLSAQAGDWPRRMKVGRGILQRGLDSERRNERLRVMADIAAQRLHDVDQALALLQEIEPRNAAEAASATERMIQVALSGGRQAMVADLLTTVVDEAVDDYAAVEALSRRAQARAAAGDLDGAMEDLDLALQRGGDALRLAALRTELADQAGRMDVVVSALEAWAIELPVGEARAAVLFRLARSLSRAEREEEGIPHLTAALEMGNEALRQRAFEALYPLLARQADSRALAELLAKHAYELEDRLAAAALVADLPGGLGKALRLAEGVVNAQAGGGLDGAAAWLLASLHERADQPAQAADQYALLRLQGDTGDEVLKLEVQARLQAGQPAAAWRLIEEHDLGAIDLRVDTLVRLERYEEAAAELEGAQEVHRVCRWGRIVGLDLAQPSRAMERLRSWLADHEAAQEVLELIEDLASRAGDVETTAWARQALGDLVHDDPLARSRWLQRAAQVASDAAEAVALLTEAAQLDTASDAIRHQLGQALERAGDFEAAAQIALDLAESSDQVGERVMHLLRAASNLRRLDPAQALQVLDRVEAVVPEDARMLRMRIELAQDQRQVDEEVRLLRRLAKVTADKAERLSALRRAAEVSGDMDLLRMVVLHDPDDVDARLALAQMAERRGDLGAAVGEFKTLASHLHGDAAAAALHRAAGLLWRVKSDAQGAIDLLGEALEVVEHAATFPEPFLLLSEIYETQGDATAAAAVLTPLFDVLAELDEEVAARVIMQAVSGGLSEIAFPYLAALEEQRPESLVLQRAVMHYLRHQRDWDSLRERLAWVAEHHDDVATDLELCARAEQGMIPAHDEAVSAALERLAARGGSIAELAVLGVTPVVIPALPGERVEVVATERGPVQVLSAAPVALDDEVGTLAPAGTAEPDEAALENELPTVPAQSAREAGVLPPVEGEDPPLDFDWGGEQTELSVAQIAGSVDELLTQAQEAELAGQIELALSCLERAAALASDDEAVRDAVASFLARHPGA